MCRTMRFMIRQSKIPNTGRYNGAGNHTSGKDGS
jgi:hypothetical protein